MRNAWVGIALLDAIEAVCGIPVGGLSVGVHSRNIQEKYPSGMAMSGNEAEEHCTRTMVQTESDLLYHLWARMNCSVLCSHG